MGGVGSGRKPDVTKANMPQPQLKVPVANVGEPIYLPNYSGLKEGTKKTDTLTAGSVLFVDSSGNISQDNSNLFWDNTNNRLGIGTTAPSSALDVIGNVEVGGTLGAFTTTPDRWANVYSSTNGHEVAYGLYANEGANDRRAKFFLDDTTGITGIDMSAATSVTDWQFQRAGTAMVTIKGDGTGNVGIGDTSPDAKLEILQSSDVETAGFQISRSNDTNYTRIYKKSTLGGMNDPLVFSSDSTADHAAIDRDGKAYFASNVGIGTTSPATSAKLEISSTTGALLVSRMNGTQRDALTAVDGMVLYNTDTAKLQVRASGAWVDLH